MLRAISRILLNGMGIVSLLISLAVVGFWIVCYHQFCGTRIFLAGNLAVLDCYEGAAFVSLIDSRQANDINDATTLPAVYIPGRWYFTDTPSATHRIKLPETEHHFLGFGFGESPADAASRVAQAPRLKVLVASMLPSPQLQRLQNLLASLSLPERRIQFPLALLAILFAILPAIQLTRFVRLRRRASKGLCPQCGYDLRATPDRCPECGTVAEKASA